MDRFIVAAGEASFAGLIAIFAIAIISAVAGWGGGCITRAVAVVLAMAVAQGARAQWEISYIYCYGSAGVGAWLLLVISRYADKRRHPACGHGG